MEQTSSGFVAELLQGCIRGDRLCQKKLYELHHGKMMAICLRYSEDYEEARDILTEGFMKVFLNLTKYQPHHPLETWMKRIMINTAIDHYRKNKKTQYHIPIENAYNESIPDDFSGLDQLSVDEILKMVQKLSPAYRTVFNLYIVEGYNHREIGEMLNISEGTSKSNLAKAKARLQVLIAEKIPHPQYIQ